MRGLTQLGVNDGRVETVSDAVLCHEFTGS